MRAAQCTYGINGDNSGYCDEPCTSDVCKQLAAGCGMSTYDIMDGWSYDKGTGWSSSHDRDDDDDTKLAFDPPHLNASSHTSFPTHHARATDSDCSLDGIRKGVCSLCEVPAWCGDPNGPFWHIQSARDWVDAFGGSDGMPIVGGRQCKYPRWQRDKFIETVRLHSSEFKDGRFDGKEWQHMWNEVNLYVGPNDGGVQKVLSENIVGLLYVRNYGSGNDLWSLQRLQDHLSRMGKVVPIYALTTEPLHDIRWAHRPIRAHAIVCDD